jgi:hypothetical protein
VIDKQIEPPPPPDATITLTVTMPPYRYITRSMEVHCGESIATVRQDGHPDNDNNWAVYAGRPSGGISISGPCVVNSGTPNALSKMSFDQALQAATVHAAKLERERLAYKLLRDVLKHGRYDTPEPNDE